MQFRLIFITPKLIFVTYLARSPLLLSVFVAELFQCAIKLTHTFKSTLLLLSIAAFYLKFTLVNGSRRTVIVCVCMCTCAAHREASFFDANILYTTLHFDCLLRSLNDRFPILDLSEYFLYSYTMSVCLRSLSAAMLAFFLSYS